MAAKGVSPCMMYVGVVGAASASEEILQAAVQLGAGIASLGAVLVCGGRGGVMEAAARGAHEVGGTVLGILPGSDPREGNPYLSLAVATGLGDARNAVIARTCDVIVAVDGGYGTLSEIALALKMGKPVIGLYTWRCETPAGRHLPLQAAVNPSEAVAICRSLLTEIKKER